MFTSEDPVDGGVCGQAGLPSFMEDPSVGQVLRQEEPPAGEHDKSHKTKLKTTKDLHVCTRETETISTLVDPGLH